MPRRSRSTRPSALAHPRRTSPPPPPRPPHPQHRHHSPRPQAAPPTPSASGAHDRALQMTDSTRIPRDGAAGGRTSGHFVLVSLELLVFSFRKKCQTVYPHTGGRVGVWKTVANAGLMAGMGERSRGGGKRRRQSELLVKGGVVLCGFARSEPAAAMYHDFQSLSGGPVHDESNIVSTGGRYEMQSSR